jgi:integrase
VRIRYIRQDRDRHGNLRLYFQRLRRGPKIRIDEAPGTPEFFAKYQRLLKSAASASGAAVQAQTYRWLCVQYFKSGAFQRLDPTYQRTRRGILEATFDEPVHPGAQETFATFPLARLNTRALAVLRDRKKGLPEAANNRVKCIRAVFKWAASAEQRLITTNPARDLERIKTASAGWHSWEVEEVRRYEECHPIGTKARLALALLMYTGVRRSDLVLLGKQHRRLVTNPDTGMPEPWLKFTQYKNRNRKPVVTEIPMLQELERIIDASPVGDLTYLVTDYGHPFTANGFGGKMREWCDQAGLPQCSSHGLRKSAAAIAAENGASAHQLMAIFGWLTLVEAERYAAAARRKRMAGAAMHLLVRKENEKSLT